MARFRILDQTSHSHVQFSTLQAFSTSEFDEEKKSEP